MEHCEDFFTINIYGDSCIPQYECLFSRWPQGVFDSEIFNIEMSFQKLAMKAQPGPARPPDPGIKRKSEFLEPTIPLKKQKGDFFFNMFGEFSLEYFLLNLC